MTDDVWVCRKCGQPPGGCACPGGGQYAPPRPGHAPASTPVSDTGTGTERPPLSPVLTRLSDVQPQDVDWLWYGRIARGKLHIIDGVPGAGKSTLTLDLVARLTTGAPWPDGAPSPGAAGAVILTAEDGLADTVRPRLDVAGADASQVASLDSVRYYGPDGQILTRYPTIADLGALRAAIVSVGASLVVIDPLAAYVGDKVNTDKDAQVRAALHPLAGLAEECGVAVLIVRHPRKAGGSAINAGGGSLGIIGAARVGWTVAKHPDDEDRVVVAVSKCNLAPKQSSLTYQLVSDTPRGCARVVWGDPVDLTADDLTDAVGAETRTTVQEAADWLKQWLADQGGESPRKDVMKAAKAEGFSESTLDRARSRVRVGTRRGGFPAQALWSLSGPPSENTEGSEGSERSEATGLTRGDMPPAQSAQFPQSPHSSQSSTDRPGAGTGGLAMVAPADLPDTWGEWTA